MLWQYAPAFWVACTPKYGSLENQVDAIDAARKGLVSEVNPGRGGIADYGFSAEFHKSWTIASSRCEDLQGWSEAEWQACNPAMYSVTVFYEDTPVRIRDHQSWNDDAASADGYFSGLFMLFTPETGGLFELDRFLVLDELGETECD